VSGGAHIVLGSVTLAPAPICGVEDAMAASIVRLECENEELRAEVALLREEQAIFKRQFAGVIEGGQRHCNSEAYATPSDLSPRTTLSDEELREEVRHKYEADRVGGHQWGNI
jgi:hypothetical protein